ncbi:MAG: hypothetical protein ACRC2T_20295 [Thermoguttaceae bacterium]
MSCLSRSNLRQESSSGRNKAGVAKNHQTFSWLINRQRNTELLASEPRFEALRRWHFIIVVRWAATGLDCLLIRHKETKTHFLATQFPHGNSAC